MFGKPDAKAGPVRHEPARHEAASEPPRGPKRNRPNWKSIVGVAIALFIAWQVFHTIDHGTKSKTSANSSAAPSASVPTPVATPTPTVTLGGHPVAATSGPSIILDPGLVAPGGQVGVDGSGFTPKTSVVVMLRSGKSSKGTVVAHGYTARDGTFVAGFTMPDTMTGNGGSVVAEDASDGKTATANLVTAGGVATAKIVGKDAGHPGNRVTVTASGFGPGEQVNVYWGRVSGTPAATVTANPAGLINPTTIPVGVAPVGNTTLVLVGQRTHTTATVPYLMLGLYPSTAMHPYAIRAGHSVIFTGTGFAPSEQVLIYLNGSGGVPAMTTTATSNGSFSVNFAIPFGLKGRQTLTAIGDESRASARNGFLVMPYMPSVQASTYGALPGTTISFYAKGFAANEVVLVYTDGKLVTAFRVNSQGSASAAGSYVVPSGVANNIYFKMVGQQSGGTGTAKVGIEPGGSTTVPQQPPYVLPPSLGGKAPATHSPGPSSSAGAPHAPAPSSKP
jgi:hypothetical protein